MIRRPPRSTQSRSSAASDVYKRQVVGRLVDDQTGEPLVNARVQLDYNMAGGTMTDEDGQFMLIFVAPGLHRLQSWGYAYTFQEQIIDVNSYAVTDIGELRFSMIADAVRGQVADANSGRPIEGAVVQYDGGAEGKRVYTCLLYTSPSPRDRTRSRMPSSD